MLSRDTVLLRYTWKLHDFSHYNILVPCYLHNTPSPTMRNAVCKHDILSVPRLGFILDNLESMQLVFIISHRLSWRYWMRSLEVYLHASCSLVHFDSFFVKDQGNTPKNVILSRDTEVLTYTRKCHSWAKLIQTTVTKLFCSCYLAQSSHPYHEELVCDILHGWIRPRR